MNIVVTSNKNFLMPLEVMLYSLYRNNKDVNTYFINFSVDHSDLDSIKKTVECFKGCSFTIIDLPQILSEKFEFSSTTSCMLNRFSNCELSIETFGKLMIPALLPYDIDRCLYLDADIIINKNIQDFYDTDFKSNFVVGMDACGYNSSRSVSGNKSFNVGVILFNLKKIRETNLLSIDNILKYIDDSMVTSNVCSDELILNRIFNGKVLFEDSYKFNLPVPSLPWGKVNKEKRLDALNNAHILHYITTNKPWKEKCTLPKESQAIWKDYYNQCFNDR